MAGFMKILIASDHAGFALKESLKKLLAGDFDFIDMGTDSADSVDYPDFAKKLCDEIQNKKAVFGVLICGSGVGVSIAANRNAYIRAALVYNDDIAKLSRQHNNANVICLGARFLDETTAAQLVKTFLNTGFEGGRHQARVEKLSC